MTESESRAAHDWRAPRSLAKYEQEIEAVKWMIDLDFFNERISTLCCTPNTKHDPHGERKLIALIQMLCGSVNGKSWRDARDLSLMLRRPLRQCERVWQLCIEENVLRPVADGYSAIEWLKEKGYYNENWKEKSGESGGEEKSGESGGKEKKKDGFSFKLFED